MTPTPNPSREGNSATTRTIACSPPGKGGTKNRENIQQRTSNIQLPNGALPRTLFDVRRWMLDVGCSAFDGFPPQKRVTYWLYVIGPDGGDLLRYEKLFDQPQAPIPGVFAIDGVPCSTYLCADRWLRGVQEIPIQQGARVSFELSCNTANEWVAPFAWYWNVPQALRNNVWVVFANTGNTVAGVADSGVPGDLRHGHSAVIAPDGPDGALLTRYDQLSATAPFAPGLNPAAMSFRVKGVRAVVTIEHDGLWTELSELAAVAGAHPSAPRPRPCRRPERAAAPPSVVGESRVVSHLQRDGECVGGDDLGRPQRLGRTAWRSATKSDWMSKERSPASITCSSIC